MTGCGVAGTAAPAGEARTITAIGYADAAAPTPTGPVLLHINILTTGVTASAAWQAMGSSVTAVRAALRAAGAEAAAIGVSGPPALTAQVGPAAVEVTQTVTGDLATPAAALALVDRLRLMDVAGFNGYYVTSDAPPLPTGSALRAADARALAQARGRAAALAAAEGGRLGALVASRSDILATVPCAPVSGCSSAGGDLTPTPGTGQVVVSVKATYDLETGG